MSVAELLTTIRAAGIQLEARGDRLHVDAPRGVLTPHLRDALARHKSELLTVLSPSRGFMTLMPDAATGFVPTLPVEAIELAIELEARGFRQSVNAAGEYRIEPAERLSDRDRSGIARWRHHLAAIIAYEPPQIS
jgi:hypothetical protein